jgi:pSer/pThr/pTyr-binding forkhead associated (FHA) protein
MSRETRPPYHPSCEFPGGDEITSHPASHTPTEPTSAQLNDFPICRLVIHESKFISSKWRLAVIDGYSEVQFGRDAPPAGVSIPRIRLRDMEVSKLHATLFWDAERTEWAVVDMGSKHGTFVGSGQDTNRLRLSETRVASMPKRLRHLDRLSLGSTTFVVHIHENRLPCSDCSASEKGADDFIPLFSHQRDGGTVSQADRGRKRAADSTDDVPRNAKRALASLKQSLLSRPGGIFPTASPHDEPAHASYHEAVRGATASNTTGRPQGLRSSPRVVGKRTVSPGTQGRSRFLAIVSPESTSVEQLRMNDGGEGGAGTKPPSKGDGAERRLKTRDAG